MKLLCAPAKAKFPGMEFDLRVDLFSNSGFKTRGLSDRRAHSPREA